MFIFRGVLLLTQCSLSCESSVHDQRKLLSPILQENISWETKPFIRGYEFLTSMLMHISCLLTCFHSHSIPKYHIFKLYQMVNQLSPDVPSQKNHDWTESSAQTNTIRKVSADQMSRTHLLASVISVCCSDAVVCSAAGCVLLNLLLQQPLDPSALGLCHLLSISPDALPNILSPHGYISP